ncbi:hypothetical protein [Paenibacillus sedimenti]|uniref:Uncharacterized protein n=1 Tax=Paenibacillus sedimenti TaxID=2770274 RepID=A0A926KJK3_9BACL|nr:hypothetical protein [Paenibacillus sedimenti]MBD0378919.1 hypothetical protein [Paenibacillus sedimenti]
MPNPSTAPAAQPARSVNLIAGLAEWGLAVSFGLMGSLGILYVSAYLILLARFPFQPLTVSTVFLIIVGCLLLWGRMVKRVLWRKLGITLLPVCVILLLAVWGSGLIYDTSFDGQGYHQLAAFSIHNGWNPIYEPEFHDSLWVNHYPKGIWVLAAAIYTLTGHLESGKAVNLIVMIASFCATFGTLLKCWSLYEPQVQERKQIMPVFLRPLMALLLAVCAACNPVTLVQLLTNYNDGAIASLLLTLISACICYAVSHDRKALSLAAIAVVILVNIKFTAIAYAGLICTWLVVALIVLELRKDGANGWSLGKRLFHSWKRPPVLRAILVLMGSALVGLVVFGWNPYVVNAMNYGHPFYPLTGKNAIDIMTLNSPHNFIGENRLKTFLLSYTSKTVDAITPMDATRAMLWPIPWEDFQHVNVDTRVAGFGPLSPWILIGSAFTWVLVCIFRPRTAAFSTLLILALLTTVFINPEPWWARYVPQLWLVPLLVAMAGMWSQRRFVQGIALLLFIIMGTNALKSADAIFHTHIKQSVQVQEQFAALTGKQLTVYPNGFISPMVHLKERGIAYSLAAGKEPICRNPMTFAFTQAFYCDNQESE